MVPTSDSFQAMSSNKPLAGQLSWQQILAPYSVGYQIKLLSQLSTRKFTEKLEPFGLWLTDGGRELETILVNVATEFREEAMAGIPNEEREMFSQILNRAIANLS
jgi:hypothetical protein